MRVRAGVYPQPQAQPLPLTLTPKPNPEPSLALQVHGANVLDGHAPLLLGTAVRAALVEDVRAAALVRLDLVRVMVRVRARARARARIRVRVRVRASAHPLRVDHARSPVLLVFAEDEGLERAWLGLGLGLGLG